MTAAEPAGCKIRITDKGLEMCEYLVIKQEEGQHLTKVVDISWWKSTVLYIIYCSMFLNCQITKSFIETSVNNE